jgi:hypothetical protein
MALDVHAAAAALPLRRLTGRDTIGTGRAVLRIDHVGRLR